VDRENFRRRACLGFLTLSLFVWPLTAGGAQEPKIDYSQVRAPIQAFEQKIAEIIMAALPGPLGPMMKPKGAFVAESGYNFIFLVNMDRAVIHSPMGTFANPDALTPEMKKKKLEALKELLMQLLYSHGPTLPLLKKEKAVTIMGFFEEFTPENGSLNKTLILSVLKSDIDESVSKQLSFNEFKNRVKIVEY
jgi:hypothetical protein